MTTILDILQHATGRDEYGRPESKSNSEYRNHYCAGEGHHGFDLCREAVASGLMTEHAPSALSGGDCVFTVTDAGRAYITANSPTAPRTTRSQTRYQAWLAEDSGDTFGKWLRRPRRRTR